MWYEDRNDEQPYRLWSQQATLDRPDASGQTPRGQKMTVMAPAVAEPESYKPKVLASSQPGTEYWLP